MILDLVKRIWAPLRKLFDPCCPKLVTDLLLVFTVASLDNHLILHARCNCRLFVFVVIWWIAKQADRNGETVKHFSNCIKVFSQFRTTYCTNLRKESNRPKRGGPHGKAQIPHLAYNFRSQILCQKITSQPSVAIATCRKTCFRQIVLLQYKAKPYQNLGCHCKILGCHFDTHKRLKITLPQGFQSNPNIEPSCN